MDATIGLTLIEAVLILLAIAILKAITLISPLDDDSSNKVVDPIPTVPSPSHIDVVPPATKYDVFLSFRGEDTRHTFSSYLYDALCKAKIQTFMDDKLHKGDHIAPLLLKTIEQSDVSLIIFSKDYASSTWCMDELVHVMKCKDKYGRIVIPIFYNVEPTNVRKQNGSFGDGFAKLKQRFNHDEQKVQDWTDALVQSTNLSGWDSKNFRPESKLIKMIVKDILSKLNNKSSSFHLEGLVGIDHRIQKVEELLSEARIVGIWGMGGIGKTTLARAVFERLKAQFEALSFVGNVRVQLGRIGLDELLEKCLKELLQDEDLNIYNLRSTFVKNRLERKKILLVLDDVDNSIAIEGLIKACDWFGEGSRIIFTSRDMQVLKNASAFTTYHVPHLDHHHALHLFSLKAFKKHEPFTGYLELSQWVVDYCGGNPLALIVLGCFLYGRGKEVWESALEKLSQALHKDILDVLKLSFDGLDGAQKEVFLELAFILNEAGRISLDCTRSLYGLSAYIEINVLKERSLISVHGDNYISMHALLMDMGLQICTEQLISNPEKPIRVRRHNDIYNSLQNDKGIDAIRCMSLDTSKIKRITLRASHFGKMEDLIFLKVYKSDQRKPSNLNILEDLDYLSEELRFLIWEQYPLQSIPLHFCAMNLIRLEMRNSNIQQLWNGHQHFPNLEVIDLSHSKHLIALPDLSHAPKIGHLVLDGCVNLAHIHSSTTLGKSVVLYMLDCGQPVQINFEGSMRGTSCSGLVFVYNSLNVKNWSFNQVTVKVLVCGQMIHSVRFKHAVVKMPLAEIAESRSLLACIRRIDWCVGPFEFGHDLKQHFTYDIETRDPLSTSPRYGLSMNVRITRLRREMSHDDIETERILDDHQVNAMRTTATTLMRVEEEEQVEKDEDDDDEALIMGYCSFSNGAAPILFTRVPKSITRWSLLTQLRLKESDMISMIWINNAQVSILKSLFPLIFSPHDDDDDGYSRRRIQPLLDVKLSSVDIGDHFFDITHSFNWRNRMHQYWGFLSLYGGVDWNGSPDSPPFLEFFAANDFNYYLN